MSHYKALREMIDDLREWTYGSEHSVRQISKVGKINNSTLSMAKGRGKNWGLSISALLNLAKARDRLEGDSEEHEFTEIDDDRVDPFMEAVKKDQQRRAMKERLKQRREES